MAKPYLFYINPSGVQDAKGIGGDWKQLWGAPDIIPITGFNTRKPVKSDVQLVDIVNNFEWTHTPAKGRHEVPFIRLSEYKVNFNSLMQSIRYLLSALGGQSMITGPGAQGQKGNLEWAQQKAQDAAIENMNVGVDQLNQKDKNARRGEIVNQYNKNRTQTGIIQKMINKLPASVTSVLHNPSDMLSQANYLHPYYGLYGAIPTGFEYYFPYFEQDWKSVGTQWGEIQGGGLFGDIIEGIFGKEGFIGTGVDTIKTLAPTAVGAFIDRPKMFAYGEDSPSVKFTFNLMNTANVDDVIRNWHLCFLLAYQNLPNKTSKVLLEPPVIYEVEIPGTFYTPYAYIKSLRITNRGATRLMTIPYLSKIPNITELKLDDPASFDKSQGRWDQFKSDRYPVKTTSGKRMWEKLVKGVGVGDSAQGAKQTTIETIIPDAYQIEIELQSMIPESKNLFYHSILGPATLNRGIYTASSHDATMFQPEPLEHDAKELKDHLTEQRRLHNASLNSEGRYK